MPGFSDRFIGAAQLPQLSEAPDNTHVLGESSAVKDLSYRDLRQLLIQRSPHDAEHMRRTGIRCAEAEWGIPIIVHGTNALTAGFASCRTTTSSAFTPSSTGHPVPGPR